MVLFYLELNDFLVHDYQVLSIKYVDLFLGPSIAFLIHLSFAHGGVVVAPVFWESNYITLRGNEKARVCFYAGQCPSIMSVLETMAVGKQVAF
jgi:hypothetical protein